MPDPEPIQPTSTLPDSRGQIGAGTLLILIAVLIVAATTAGVLFDVTDSLQSEASVTGAAVGEEVDSDLRVAAVTGRVNQSRDPVALETLRIVVARDGAEGAVDLSKSSVRVQTDTGTSNLDYATDGPVAGSTFGVESLRDPDGSATVIDGVEDRFAVVIETPPLEVGDQIRVELVQASGSTETVTVRVPERIRTESPLTLA